MTDPQPEITEADVLHLREMTGVGSEEYDLDGVTYWTDEQLEGVLSRWATLNADAETVIDWNSAEAQVLESWAARLITAYDVTMDGQTLRRSQMAAALMARADALRGDSAEGNVVTVEVLAPE